MRGIAGIDVGGTFTDVIALDPTRGIVIAKTPTTPDDQSMAVMAGLDDAGLDLTMLEQIVHGTTTGTNTTIERNGATAALVTTRGFRDVLELGRRDRPNLYGLGGGFEPLVPRRHRVEVGGRLGPDGQEVSSLTPEDLDALVAKVAALRVESVAICLMHSYANDAHEVRVESALREALPDLYVIRSTSLYPELGEFERTSTTVIAAYVGPIMGWYLENLDNRLKARDFGRDYMVVSSNGGAASHRIAIRFPTSTILSGPAAGVVAAQRVAQAAGSDNVVSFDMGGTSADIAVIAKGQIAQSVNNSLGFRLPLQVPMLEIDTIGAGGGSIAGIDDAGILRVGPKSAGSVPGPACYGRGGLDPTVTDAHAVLGHFPLDALVRNHIESPDIDAAGEVLDQQVARPLDLSVDAAAEAVLEVVAENMAGRIRLLTVERGLDIRTFDLVAFGGAGPLHVCALMRKLGIARAFIPPYPGLTSALGTVMADVRHDFVQTFRRRLGEVSADDFVQVVELHRQAGKDLLAEQGLADISAHEVTLAFLYDGQRHSVDVGIDAEVLDQLADSKDDLHRELSARFEAAYEAKHGSCLDRPVVLVSLRSTVVAEVESLALSMCADALRSGGGAAPYEVHATFAGLRSVTRVVDRSSLGPGDTLDGPAIVIQRDTTTLIEPGFVATDTADGILIITEAS
jgi:N-methylhydantoinase A